MIDIIILGSFIGLLWLGLKSSPAPAYHKSKKNNLHFTGIDPQLFSKLHHWESGSTIHNEQHEYAMRNVGLGLENKGNTKLDDIINIVAAQDISNQKLIRDRLDTQSDVDRPFLPHYDYPRFLPWALTDFLRNKKHRITIHHGHLTEQHDLEA